MKPPIKLITFICKGSIYMKNVYNRKLSVNERMFLAMSEFSVVANQLIVEGTGTNNLKQWQSAVEQASRANPGSRLVLKGMLPLCRWVDSGISPPVREVDGSTWDGYGPEGAPFLNNCLDPQNGPACEILLVRGNPVKDGNPVRIVFRTHHAVMDGRGSLFWVEDIMRVLNGLKPVGSSSNLTDTELARSFQKKFRRSIKKKYLAPTGKAVGKESGMIWHRVEIKGSIPNLVAQAAVILAEEAWGYAQGPLLFGIPVDMRRHRVDLTSTANLTYCIYVEVNPGTIPEQVSQEIAQQLKEKKEGMLSWEDELYRFVPIKIISHQARKIIESKHAHGSYSISGFLSNLGRIPLERFPSTEFKINKLWFIPPSIEYAPLAVVFAGYYDQISLIIAAPKRLATDGRLNSAIDHLTARLTTS
jgi:hypothetical protein